MQARERFDETVEILEAARSRQEFPGYLEEPLESLLRQLETTEACH